MSVWSTVEGTVKVPKNSLRGLKDLVQEQFGNLDCGKPLITLIKEERDSRIFEVVFNFEQDGIAAAYVVRNFTDKCEWYGFKYRLNATIQFLG